MISRMALLQILIRLENQEKSALLSNVIQCVDQIMKQSKIDFFTEVDLLSLWQLLAKENISIDENDINAPLNKLFKMFGRDSLNYFNDFVELSQSAQLMSDIIALMKAKGDFFGLASVLNELRKLDKLTKNTIILLNAFESAAYEKLADAIHNHPVACDVLLFNPDCTQLYMLASIVSQLENNDVYYNAGKILKIENLGNVDSILHIFAQRGLLSNHTYEHLIQAHHPIFCSDEMVQFLKEVNPHYLNQTMVKHIKFLCDESKNTVNAIKEIKSYLTDIGEKFRQQRWRNTKFGKTLVCDDVDYLAALVNNNYYPQHEEKIIAINLQMDLRNRDINELQKLFLTGYFKQFNYLMLDISGNLLDATRLKKIMECLSDKYISENFHLGLSCNSMDQDGFDVIKQAFQVNRIPSGFSIDFSNTLYQPDDKARAALVRPVLDSEKNLPIDTSIANVIVAMLPIAPRNFTLQLNTVSQEAAQIIADNLHLAPAGTRLSVSDMRAKQLEIFAKGLRKTTNVVTFATGGGYGFSGNLEEYKISQYFKVINHCCLRNQLLLKYPELEAFIKKISMDNGLYVLSNEPRKPGTLSTLCASFLLFNQQGKQLDQTKLPVDVQEFIAAIQTLKAELDKDIPKASVIKKFCS